MSLTWVITLLYCYIWHYHNSDSRSLAIFVEEGGGKGRWFSSENYCDYHYMLGVKLLAQCWTWSGICQVRELKNQGSYFSDFCLGGIINTKKKNFVEVQGIFPKTCRSNNKTGIVNNRKVGTLTLQLKM